LPPLPGRAARRATRGPGPRRHRRSAVPGVGPPEAGQAALTRLGWDGLALVDDGRLRADLKIRAVPWTLTLRGDGTAREAFVGKRDYATLHAALGRVK
jgi:hypothetical protein